MTRTFWLGLPATALAAAFVGAAPGAIAGGHTYVGAPACGTSSCHGGKTPGNEMKTWSGKDPHASAFDPLSEEKGRKVAKAAGVDAPEEDAACLSCHATGGDAPAALKEKTLLAEDGVACESCHGPGGTYKDEKHQKDHAWAVANGMVDLKNKDVRKATCDGCHGKIDDKLVAAGHPKASTYAEREAAYEKFAHWKK